MDQPGLNRLRVQDRADLAELLATLNGAMNAPLRHECVATQPFSDHADISAPATGRSTSTFSVAPPSTGPTPRSNPHQLSDSPSGRRR